VYIDAVNAAVKDGYCPAWNNACKRLQLITDVKFEYLTCALRKWHNQVNYNNSIMIILNSNPY